MTGEERCRGPQAARFRRLAAIGHGGMADVFLACARGVGGAWKLLVLKELRPALVRDPEYRAMFQREARLSTLLSHPNVVHTYEVGSEDGRPFIAMEYLEGQPLHRILRRLHRPPPEPRGLPLAMHLRILAEVLAGLHYVHELRDLDGVPLGLVHRDVSPHNVLVTYDGQIKLIDFGIAHHGGDGDTEVGTFKGKAAYASPEQARGEAVDRRSDVFSVGVMLWEALARRRMWEELDELAIARRLEAGAIPRLPVDVDAPAALRELCEAALSVSPAARPPSADAFREALEAHLGQKAPFPREIGATLARVFADDRESLRTVVAAQLRRARAAQDDLPLVDLSDPPGSPEADEKAAAHPDEPTRRDGARPPDAPASPYAARPTGPHDATWPRPITRPVRPAWARWLAAGCVAAVGVLTGFMSLRTWNNEHVAKDMSKVAEIDRCGRPDRPSVALAGDIERDAELGCDRVYRLDGTVVVRPGATLTIAPGTAIVGAGETGGTLVLEPGARLVVGGAPEDAGSAGPPPGG
ncbi:MAG TPA: protein kinase [Nannocystis sp.]